MRLIEQLDTVRQEKGITKKALCAYADISVDYYIKVLNHSSHDITVGVAEKLGQRVGLTLVWAIDLK